MNNERIAINVGNGCLITERIIDNNYSVVDNKNKKFKCHCMAIINYVEKKRGMIIKNFP